MSENCYTEYFLSLFSQTYLFHWCTPKYAEHMSLDKLLNKLKEHIDKFVEIYLAKFNKQPVQPFNISMKASSDCSDIIGYYETQIDNLKKIKNALKTAPELQGIVEGMVGDINQAIYVMKLV